MTAGSAVPETDRPALGGVHRDAGPEPRDPGRGLVCAVLVVHDGDRWLPRTLEAMQAQQQRPYRTIAVDTGSRDASAQLLAGSAAVDEIITLPAGTTFGRAVAAAERALVASAAGTDGTPPAVPEWLWLIHDDCAPEPEALRELLAAAQRSPSAAVLGPKARGWHDGSLLVQCGLSITNSGRAVTGLEVGDRDQGQRDGLGDVLAVGSAGMLVRRDVWSTLGGFDPELPMFGDDIEFCMRARRADQRVLVVPTAVVHHREAALHGVRSMSADQGPPTLAARSAGLYTALVHGPAWLLPITSALLLVRTLFTALLMLLVAGPRRAGAELRVWLGVHLHPIRVVRARRRLRRVAVVPRRDLRELRPGILEQWGLATERWAVRLAASMRPRRAGSPIGLGPAILLGLGLAAVAAIATRGVLASSGVLAGGALLPPVDGSTLWESFRAVWHDVGLGSTEPAPAYPLVLAALALPPIVSVDAVVQTLLLFTVPMAAVSAFLALRGLPNALSRAGLAMAYALTPATIAPSLDGRLGTAVVAVALPWLVRLGIRITDGADAAQLPPARVRTAAAAALLLAVCASFAPLVWVAAAVLLLVAGAVRCRSARTWAGIALVLVMPLVLLWPWSGALLADPSRIMFEAGINSPQLVAQSPPGWRLLGLDPGTLGPAVGWAGLPLAVVAGLALLLRRSRGVAVWGWLVVAVGLLGATVLTTQKFVPIGATTAQYGFAGPMVLLMACGMVVAAAGVVVSVRPDAGLGARLLSIGLVGVLAVGPVLLALVWSTRLEGPLRRTDETVIPAFVTEQALSADRIRTLVLERDAAGAVAYALVNGDGGRIGDADVAPPAETWREISAAVGSLAAGVGPQPVEVLAENAVRFVVADAGDTELAAALDGNSALRRLSTTGGLGLWRVDGVTSRARLEAGAAVQTLPMLPPGEGDGVVLDTEAAAIGRDSRVVIAQVNDGTWWAEVDGVPAQVSGDTATTVALPSGGQHSVVIGHDRLLRQRSLLAALAALLILALLLLPRRQPSAAVPDPDRGEDAPAADPASELLDLTDDSAEGRR